MKSVSNFNSKQKQELELLAYEKFDPNWFFSVKQSGTNEHFLDLVWNDGKYTHEIGYVQTPTIAFNYKKPSGIC